MSGDLTYNSTMPESQLATKRRAVNLWLPLSPILGPDADFEDEFDANDLFEGPSTGSSFGTGLPSPFCVSRFSDDSEIEDATYSATCADEFEVWDDDFEMDVDTVDTGAEVTFESDGAQLIHIPFDSPFYHPRSPPHSLPTPFSEDTTSSSSSSSSSSSGIATPSEAFKLAGFDDCLSPRIVNIAHASHSEQPGIQKYDATGGPAQLGDTAFTHSGTPEIIIPALSASWYFSGNLNNISKSSYRWQPGRDTDLDVPCSAISVGDDWDDRQDGLSALARRQLAIGC